MGGQRQRRLSNAARALAAFVVDVVSLATLSHMGFCRGLRRVGAGANLVGAAPSFSARPFTRRRGQWGLGGGAPLLSSLRADEPGGSLCVEAAALVASGPSCCVTAWWATGGVIGPCPQPPGEQALLPGAMIHSPAGSCMPVFVGPRLASNWLQPACSLLRLGPLCCARVGPDVSVRVHPCASVCVWWPLASGGWACVWVEGEGVSVCERVRRRPWRISLMAACTRSVAPSLFVIAPLLPYIYEKPGPARLANGRAPPPRQALFITAGGPAVLNTHTSYPASHSTTLTHLLDLLLPTTSSLLFLLQTLITHTHPHIHPTYPLPHHTPSAPPAAASLFPSLFTAVLLRCAQSQVAVPAQPPKSPDLPLPVAPAFPISF